MSKSYNKTLKYKLWRIKQDVKDFVAMIAAALVAIFAVVFVVFLWCLPLIFTTVVVVMVLRFMGVIQ